MNGLSLYDIETELAEALTIWEECPEDESALAIVREYATAAAEKRDRLARAVTVLNDQMELGRKEIERLSNRVKSLANKEERLRFYIMQVMQAAGLSKMEGNLHKFSLRQNPPSVDVQDETAIPAEFVVVKTSTSVDKRAIGAVLKNNGHVNGASLRPGSMSLVVK